MSNQEKLSLEESACLDSVKNSPELDKRNIFETTCRALSKHSREVVLSLLLSTGIVNAKETTNYSQFEQFGITQTIPTQEIPADLRQGVIQVQENYLNALNEGKITFPMRIDTVGSSASEIVNDLSSAPRKTLEEILGVKDFRYIVYKRDGKLIIDPKEIDENNFEFSKVGYKKDLYKHIIEKLFDTSDVEIWLRSGYEKREYTPEELQKYKDEMALTKQRWLEKMTSMISLVKDGTMSADVFYEGQELFIKGVQSLSIEPSREAYRRLFVNAMTIAFWENVKDKEQISDLVKKELIANIGEYMQLTNKEFEMLRLGFGEVGGYVLVEYRIPSSEDLKKSKILGDYPYLQELSMEGLNLFLDKQKFESELEVLEAKYEAFLIHKEADEIHKEADEIHKEADLAEKFGILLDELKEQRQELIDLFKDYQKTGNVDLIPKIEKGIKNLKTIESNFEKLFLVYEVKKEDMDIVKLRISELYDAYKKILG